VKSVSKYLYDQLTLFTIQALTLAFPANENYADDDFNKIDFSEVQRIAGTCVTGCDIVDPGPIADLPEYQGFVPRLVRCAKNAWEGHKA
jgi:hypothetical protein